MIQHDILYYDIFHTIICYMLCLRGNWQAAVDGRRLHAASARKTCGGIAGRKKRGRSFCAVRVVLPFSPSDSQTKHKQHNNTQASNGTNHSHPVIVTPFLCAWLSDVRPCFVLTASPATRPHPLPLASQGRVG